MSYLNKIFKKTKKINEPEINEPEFSDLPEFSDFEKIVLKMCNGEAPLYNIDRHQVFFKYEKRIYGIWFANDIYGIGLYSIDAECIDGNLQKHLKIRKNICIELWNKYGELYQKFKKYDVSFKKAKEFEEKYSIKIIK